MNPAGIEVLAVRLNDLTYAPEIAQAMLMRQQAMALIDARKTIVEGAVAIVGDAIERLNGAGLEVSAGQRDALVANIPSWIENPESPLGQIRNFLTMDEPHDFEQAAEAGALIELTVGGKQPITLPNGETRTFLDDGDAVTSPRRCP